MSLANFWLNVRSETTKPESSCEGRSLLFGTTQVARKTQPQTYTVYVQTLDGKRTKMFVDDTMALKKLKSDYAEYTGTNASNISLYFQGKCLVASHDSKTLKELKITAECVIHKKEKCTGGWLFLDYLT